MVWLIAIFVISIIALLFAGVLTSRIRKNSQGTPEMREISKYIQKGAKSYLNSQYKVLIVFVIIVAIILALIKINTAIAFIIGALFSALAGNIGMRTATSANARTANACKDSLNNGLKVAFSSGAVMGMVVVGLGLLGVSVLYLIFNDVSILFGFGFGASSIALFARVGGGIYTKAADVGADLVGKVEAGIPEDDPRNPATIADNVGDNVGDVAGMGADLFESYVDSIIAALAISVIAYTTTAGMLLPMLLAGVGILSSIIGYFFVRTGQDEHGLHKAMNKGIFASAILMAIFAYFLITYTLGFGGLGVFYALLSGLIAGLVIGMVTEFYTSAGRGPTRSIAEASQTGPATNIIAGISVGMQSTLVPILAVCAAIGISYYFAGLYGIAIAAVGMLSTLGITLAADTYGPVADNAAGIAEMAKMGKSIRERAEALDAVGNTTAAIGKGFAIGSAALTALALFAVYSETAGISVMSITNPLVMIGIFIGALLPFLFTSLTMSAVGKTAMKMVNEVRRQFKEIKGLLKGKAKPDYEKCVEISTSAALRQMILPSVITIVTPIIIGVFLGPEALGGLLAGAITTGFLLALFMANAGGAWDNAKKYVEEGNLGGKGSAVHKAAVVGDTVGDPFKDTSGPSLNILIKLISIIALLFASLFL
ncbi:MAG: sodium-translocating pyrophosphatase [Candidatus Aenigmatarchaeota archaeon]|nr:MAG: sodium-translocating pyrophosphatase [Candidatus Aenigmarchaeota archaeon]